VTKSKNMKIIFKLGEVRNWQNKKILIAQRTKNT